MITRVDLYDLYPELKNEFVWLLIGNQYMFNLINNQDEVEILAKLAKRHRFILEFGTFLASSSLMFLMNGANRVVTVDKEIPLKSLLSLPVFSCSCDDSLLFVVSDSRDERFQNMLKEFCFFMGKFDFVFIDGGHDYDVVKNDFLLSLDVLKEDGEIVFHDYHPTWPGVVRFIEELERNAVLYLLNNTSFILFRREDNENFRNNNFS